MQGARIPTLACRARAHPLCRLLAHPPAVTAATTCTLQLPRDHVHAHVLPAAGGASGARGAAAFAPGFAAAAEQYPPTAGLASGAQLMMMFPSPRRVRSPPAAPPGVGESLVEFAKGRKVDMVAVGSRGLGSITRCAGCGAAAQGLLFPLRGFPLAEGACQPARSRRSLLRAARCHTRARPQLAHEPGGAGQRERLLHPQHVSARHGGAPAARGQGQRRRCGRRCSAGPRRSRCQGARP